MDDPTHQLRVVAATIEAFDCRGLVDLHVCLCLVYRELRKPNPYRAYLGWRRIA